MAFERFKGNFATGILPTVPTSGTAIWADFGHRMHVHALKKTDGHQEYYQGAAAETHERQRHPRDRHDADGHADVHEHLEHEHPGDAGGYQGAIRAIGTSGRSEMRATPRGANSTEQQRRSQKAQLLPHHGEDEVGVVLGEEAQIAPGCPAGSPCP